MKPNIETWTTMNGKKTRVCDMSDNHIHNTINLLYRYVKYKTEQTLILGYSLESSMNGDMALNDIEQQIDNIEESGLDAHEICPILETLENEERRRTKCRKNTENIHLLQ